MNNQEIIDNAPEGATHIEDNSNLYIKVLPRVTSTIFNDWFIFEIDQWIIIDTYNVLLMRSLADIKRIVELEDLLKKFRPRDEDGDGWDFVYDEGSEYLGEAVLKALKDKL
jgi:hypothetical protein